MSQDMYKCNTCSFEEDEGVCSTCVNTCHGDHDVLYAGYMKSPSCACGRKGEESCLNLIGEFICIIAA